MGRPAADADAHGDVDDALAFPLAVLVALGRRSNMPAIRSLCTSSTSN
jgi:hypothetical protein